MAAQTIVVYIDPSQLAAQKANNYSLFLAKMVNGQFTVIWQARGAVASVIGPSYEYQNVFQVTAPSYQVNYGTVTDQQGWIAFTAAGLAQNIALGQAVALDQNGIFGVPSNDGAPGQITIENQLQGNPAAILLDSAGNPIFVDVQSGMDIGPTALTPVDTYQLWFDNFQDSGTIIAHNVANPGIVTFDGGATNQVISYTAQGQWQAGPLASIRARLGDPISVTVLVDFALPLTPAAVSYLQGDFIDDFVPGLRPSSLRAQIGGSMLSAVFEGPSFEDPAAQVVDFYEIAVDRALRQAVTNPAAGLLGQRWTLSEPE